MKDDDNFIIKYLSLKKEDLLKQINIINKKKYNYLLSASYVSVLLLLLSLVYNLYIVSGVMLIYDIKQLLKAVKYQKRITKIKDNLNQTNKELNMYKNIKKDKENRIIKMFNNQNYYNFSKKKEYCKTKVRKRVYDK